MSTLDTNQRTAAEHTAAVLRIDAGPGAGKTAVLAARVAHILASGRYRAGQMAALTFTRAMAGDLRRRIAGDLPERIPCRACNGIGHFAPEHDGATGFDCGACAGTGHESAEGIAIGTLHALAAGWVRLALRDDIAGGPAVRALGIVKDHDFGIALPEDVDAVIAQAQADIGKKKITQKALKEGLTLFGADLAGWPTHTEARRQLRVRGLVTYDDLLVMLLAVASARKDYPKHRTLRDVVPCLIVDEMQDLSAAHWRIILAWDPECLTYVGDDGQAIYDFMGKAKGEAATAAEVRAPIDARATVVRLGRNYRSLPHIVEAADKIRRSLHSIGACSDLPLVAHREGPGRISIYDHTVEPQMTHRDRTILAVQSAIFVAGEPERVAVLAPLNTEVDEIVGWLVEAGIEAARIERPRAIWATVHGRAVVAMARAAELGFWTRFDVLAILTACGVSHDVLDRVEAEAFDLRRPLGLLLNERADIGASPAWWSTVAATSDVRALATLGLELRARGGAGIAAAVEALETWRGDDAKRRTTPTDFVVWLASGETVTSERRQGAVCVSTIHGSKGLEWPSVVVVGASERVIPPMMANDESSIRSWERALYVAMTRAADDLTLVCPLVVRDKPRHPSRLLVDAGIAVRNPAADAAPGPVAGPAAVLREVQDNGRGRTDLAAPINLFTGEVEPTRQRIEVVNGFGGLTPIADRYPVRRSDGFGGTFRDYDAFDGFGGDFGDR